MTYVIVFLIAAVALMHLVPPIVAWFAASRRGRKRLPWAVGAFLFPYLLIPLLQLRHRSRPTACSAKRWAIHFVICVVIGLGVLIAGERLRLMPGVVHYQADAVAFIAPVFIDGEITHTSGSVQLWVDDAAIALAEAFVYKGITASLAMSASWSCLILRGQPLATLVAIVIGLVIGVINDLATSIVVLDLYHHEHWDAPYNAVRYFWFAVVLWAMVLLARFVFVDEDPDDPDADLTAAPPPPDSSPATM